MAKGDQEKLMGDIDDEKTRVKNQNQTYLSGIQSRLGSPSKTNANGQQEPGTGLLAQQQQQLNTVTPQFQNFASTGGITDKARADLSRDPGSISSQYGAKIDDAANSTFGPWGTINSAMVKPDYGEADSGYRSLAANGGIDATTARSTFANLQGPNAGVDQSIINSLKDTSGKFGDVNDSISKLKGVDFSGVDSSIKNLNDFSATGGLSAEDLARINRPLFEEFEKTGGYSDADKANIKKEANSGVSATYNNLTDALARQKASSGGYGASFGNAAQKLARDSAISSGDQDLKTNIGLADTIRAGKMDAAKQIASNQLDLTKTLTPAKLAALQSVGTLNTSKVGQQSTNLSDAGKLGLGITDQQIGALGKAGDLSRDQGQLQLAAAMGDVSAQKAIQEGKIAGLGGLSSSQTNQAQFGLNKASQLADNAKTVLNAQGDQAKLSSGNVTNLMNTEQQGKMFGTQGLSNLYNSTTNQISDADKNYLAGLGLDENTIAQLLGIQQRASSQPGKNQQMFGNIMSGVGAGAGAISGLGGLFGGR